ncbi:SCO family protein [Aneurinibacillus sp. REN35]|uniref:SCO family protein n=1 Tax=Aneurinibacillus sp. REN35 TaxID=3237286 RepID=UPI0035289DAF
MKGKILHNRFAVLASLVIIAVIAIILYQNFGGYRTLPVIEKAPAFTMKDMYGQPFSFDKSEGSVRLVSFHYVRCPDVCQTTNLNLIRIQQKLKEEGVLGKEADLITITFDPKNDTEDVLQKYTAARNIQPDGWTFLRGTPQQTKQVLDGFKLYVQDQGNGLLTHSNELFLVDKERNIRAIYQMGDGMDNDRIVEDMLALLDE